MTITAYFDGLCEPRNPGGYACGGWFIAPTSEFPGLEGGLRGHRYYLNGPHATNNVAEYRAALDALNAVSGLGYRGSLQLKGDSQLVINQFNGTWRCNKASLQFLLAELRDAAAQFERVELSWAPRDLNAIADEESRKAYQEAR